ncbi:MAG: hypothetical protein QOC92_3854 [Acidimicrobiaceae bacterium]|jgi:hypothetical protein
MASDLQIHASHARVLAIGARCARRLLLDERDPWFAACHERIESGIDVVGRCELLGEHERVLDGEVRALPERWRQGVGRIADEHDPRLPPVDVRYLFGQYIWPTDRGWKGPKTGARVVDRMPSATQYVES